MKLNACEVVQRKRAISLCWLERNFSDIIVHRDKEHGWRALSQNTSFYFNNSYNSSQGPLCVAKVCMPPLQLKRFKMRIARPTQNCPPPPPARALASACGLARSVPLSSKRDL